MGVSLFTQFLTVCLGPPAVGLFNDFARPQGFWNSTYLIRDDVWCVGWRQVFETKNMGNWARESWKTYLDLFQWNDSPRLVPCVLCSRGMDSVCVIRVGFCEGQFTQPPFHHSEREILNLANEFSTHPNSPKGWVGLSWEIGSFWEAILSGLKTLKSSFLFLSQCSVPLAFFLAQSTMFSSCWNKKQSIPGSTFFCRSFLDAVKSTFSSNVFCPAMVLSIRRKFNWTQKNPCSHPRSIQVDVPASMYTQRVRYFCSNTWKCTGLLSECGIASK